MELSVLQNEKINLTEGEWYVMECLWESAPRTGREAVEYLKEHNNWSRSTTLTMLRRMTEKGIIRCDESGEMRNYYPLVERSAVVIEETENFLERIFNGSLTSMVCAFTERQSLSKDEIDELYAILDRAKENKK